MSANAHDPDLSALLREYQGQERLLAAWALGQVPPEVRERFRAGAGEELRAALASLDAPETARLQRDLLEVAACLVEGQRHSAGAITSLALEGGPEVVLRTFQDDLRHWLKGLGLAVPEGATDVLRHLAGSEAVRRFRHFHALIDQLRERAGRGALSALELSVCRDYPELLAGSAGRPTHALSFREFLARRLLELCRQRSPNFSLSAAFARLTEEDGASLGRIIAGPAATPALPDVAGPDVLALLAGDPEPATTTIGGPTSLSPTSLTRFLSEKQWPLLREKLMQYPVLAEVLAWVGLPEGLQERFLAFILEQAPQQTHRSFRQALGGWLDDFARAEGLTLLRPLASADWSNMVERAVVRAVLERPGESEPDWALAFRQSGLDMKIDTLTGLEALELPGGFARTAGFPRFKRNLLALARVELTQANESWEVALAG